MTLVDSASLRRTTVGGETIPAPHRITGRAPNGNTVVLYDRGDPVPIEEARALGITAAKAREAPEETKAVAPPTKRKGK